MDSSFLNCKEIVYAFFIFTVYAKGPFNRYNTIIKDKSGKHNSSDTDYWPVSYQRSWRGLLNRLEKFVSTSDNQFGFKPKLGTDMCIYALKEILDLYNRYNTTIFTCFIDLSKAFDHVSHKFYC